MCVCLVCVSRVCSCAPCWFVALLEHLLCISHAFIVCLPHAPHNLSRVPHVSLVHPSHIRCVPAVCPLRRVSDVRFLNVTHGSWVGGAGHDRHTGCGNFNSRALPFRGQAAQETRAQRGQGPGKTSDHSDHRKPPWAARTRTLHTATPRCRAGHTPASRACAATVARRLPPGVLRPVTGAVTRQAAHRPISSRHTACRLVMP